MEQTITRFRKTLICPNCSTTDLDMEPFRKGKARGYDCYCSNCEWSGDILPDYENRFYASLAGTVKEKNPMEQAIERMKNRDE